MEFHEKLSPVNSAFGLGNYLSQPEKMFFRIFSNVPQVKYEYLHFEVTFD